MRSLQIVVLFALVILFDPSLLASDGWVTTWSTSPQPVNLNYGEPNPGFENITLRQIVHSSIAGHRARVRFSNAYSDRSLVIGEAQLATRKVRSAIVPGSSRTLLFRGERSVTIPPNASFLSDCVDLDFAPESDLAISVFLPEATGPATWHIIALQTSYASAPGNHTGDQDLKGSSTTDAWFFLRSVEVDSENDPLSIVALGDSITDGATSTVDANHRWPDYLARRLLKAGKAAGVSNAGIAGNRLLHDGYGENALARFDADVLAQPGVTHLILLEGINDINDLLGKPSEAVSAEQIITALQQLAERAHSRQVKAIGGTLTPADLDPQREAKRQAVNAWIRTSDSVDGYIDFDAAVRDPKHPTRLLPKYDSGDGLHPGDAGYAAMAEAIDLNLLSR